MQASYDRDNGQLAGDRGTNYFLGVPRGKAPCVGVGSGVGRPHALPQQGLGQIIGAHADSTPQYYKREIHNKNNRAVASYCHIRLIY